MSKGNWEHMKRKQMVGEKNNSFFYETMLKPGKWNHLYFMKKYLWQENEEG